VVACAAAVRRGAGVTDPCRDRAADGRELSPQLRVRLARAGETVAGRPVPEIVCFAGHDAGVLAEHIPSAVVLVRNRSGVSHAPEESVDLADAATAANVVVAALG